MRDHIAPWENAVWNTNERYEKHRSNQKSFDFPDHYQLLARLDVLSATYIYQCQTKPNSAIGESVMQEILLTTEQVARYLKVDKFTVYRLVTQRKIPAFRVGNQWRYKKKLIDAWLLENSNMDRRESN